MTDAERTARREFLVRTQALQAELARAAASTRTVREQLTALLDQVKAQPNPPASVVDGAAALAKALADLATRIGAGGGGDEEGAGGGGLRGRVAGLFSELDGSGVHQGTLTGPTAVQRQRLEAAQADARTIATALDKALGADLAALNDEIARLKIPRIARPR